MTGKYILNGKTPERCEDLMKWGAWFETANRHVAKTMIGTASVSTVFLGIDHNFMTFAGPSPLLFETMIFGGPMNNYQERYSTWNEAELGHDLIVARLKAIENPWTSVLLVIWNELPLFKCARWVLDWIIRKTLGPDYEEEK